MLGLKLMQLVKSYAENEKCFQIQWQTPDFNHKAIEFYKKLGGVSKKKERFFLVKGRAARRIRSGPIT